MLESIFNKVRRYCFSKYKLHRRRFLSKYSEILTLAFRKVFGAFVPVLHEANPIAAVFLSYLLEALTFIPWSFDLHVRKNYSCYYNYYGTFFVFLVIQYTDMSVKPYQFEPLKKKNVQGMLKKIAGIRQKLKMRLNIVNTIWKQFFAFSKFTAEENKERCNLDDAEGLLMFTI